MTLDDTVSRSQPQTGPFTLLVSGEKGIEDLLHRCCIHPGSAILHSNFNILSKINLMTKPLFSGQFNTIRC